MSENQNPNNQTPGESTTGSEGTRQAADNSWREVGQQFQALGESIAQAFRVSWENEDTQRQVGEMRTGLERMVQDVSKAIEDSANTPQGQKIRQEAGKAADTLKTATEQTVQEARPHLVSALERLNNELQRLIVRLENPTAAASAKEEAKTEEPPQSM